MKPAKNKTTNSHRTFLRSALFGTGALLATPSLLTLSSCTAAATSKRATPNPDFNADIEIDLKAVIDKVQILPGQPTTVWRYKASILKGPASTVQNLNDTFTGPVFRFKKGQKVRIFFRNNLPEESIVHWHGLHIPEIADGHPRFVIGEGQTFVYEFEIVNRAGTYWFHPHPHGRTGPQVYNGLAGLFIITNDEEQALDLPTGKQDIPVVIQDRTFDSKNRLVYLQNRIQRMTGFLGDTITVNGKPNASLNLNAGTYRLRVLNGSNSRIYKLAFNDGTPLTAIATDGGLLAAPVQKRYIMLGTEKRKTFTTPYTMQDIVA